MDVNEKLIDSIFDSIHTRLEDNFSYEPELVKNFIFLDEKLFNYNKFKVRIDIDDIIYYFELYQIHKYNFLYKILKYFKLDSYYLIVTIRQRGFIQDTYYLKSNKSNYDRYKELYNALMLSKPIADKKKYTEKVNIWIDKLNSVISVSRKRDQKLNKLINK